MVKTIVELIDLAVSSLMSEMICKKNASFWDRVKFSCFNKNLRRWVSQFINGNDGTVLTTDDFERYFRYHKPVEKIYEAIVGENLQNTKDKTIDELVSKFKSTRTQSEHTAPEEYMLIRDLFSGIYNRIDQFYWRQLSDSEKYIVTQIKKEAGEIATLEKKGNEQIEQSVREVKELLKEGHSYSKQQS